MDNNVDEWRRTALNDPERFDHDFLAFSNRLHEQIAKLEEHVDVLKIKNSSLERRVDGCNDVIEGQEVELQKFRDGESEQLAKLNLKIKDLETCNENLEIENDGVCEEYRRLKKDKERLEALNLDLREQVQAYDGPMARAPRELLSSGDENERTPQSLRMDNDAVQDKLSAYRREYDEVATRLTADFNAMAKTIGHLGSERQQLRDNLNENRALTVSTGSRDGRKNTNNGNDPTDHEQISPMSDPKTLVDKAHEIRELKRVIADSNATEARLEKETSELRRLLTEAQKGKGEENDHPPTAEGGFQGRVEKLQQELDEERSRTTELKEEIEKLSAEAKRGTGRELSESAKALETAQNAQEEAERRSQEASVRESEMVQALKIERRLNRSHQGRITELTEESKTARQETDCVASLLSDTQQELQDISNEYASMALAMSETKKTLEGLEQDNKNMSKSVNDLFDNNDGVIQHLRQLPIPRRNTEPPSLESEPAGNLWRRNLRHYVGRISSSLFGSLITSIPGAFMAFLVISILVVVSLLVFGSIKWIWHDDWYYTNKIYPRPWELIAVPSTWQLKRAGYGFPGGLSYDQAAAKLMMRYPG